jgi:hypothetical protein
VRGSGPQAIGRLLLNLPGNAFQGARAMQVLRSISEIGQKRTFQGRILCGIMVWMLTEIRIYRIYEAMQPIHPIHAGICRWMPD